MRRRRRPARPRNNSSKGNEELRLFGGKVTRPALYKAAIGALTACLLFVALLTRVLPQQAPFREGQVADHQISATRSANYIDTEATQKRRQEARDKVQPVYKTEPRVDPNADALARQTVSLLFQAVVKARSDRRLRTQQERIAAVKRGLAVQVSDNSLSILVRCSDRVLPQLEARALDRVQAHMAQGVLREELAAHRKRVAEEIADTPVWEWYGPAVVEVAQVALEPNRVLDIDEEKTEAARQAAAAAVKPEERTIVPGEIIIRPGDTVTRLHIDKFKALGLIHPHVDYVKGVAVAAVVLCLVVLFGLYLRERAPEVYGSPAQLAFVGGCIIAPVALAQFSVRYPVFPAVAVSAVCFGAMVLSALLGTHIGVVGSIVMGTLSSVATSPSDPRIMTATTIAGIVGAFAVSFVARRTHVAATAALVMAIANTVVLLAANGAFGLRTGPNDVFYTVIGGILAGVFAVIAVLAFDRPLGITTDIRLAELANPNSPLLRRLMEEAPGTYMSSMMLANWCETCAAAIDANPLLARVGTYYHDIGKLEKPFYFIENQFGERNPHDVLEPALSARVIARHTKDGYRLAKHLGLPQRVCDMTRMHHGTSLIKYFYHRAKERSGDDNIDESQFRHVGVKPAFKEAGILMIADTVEAAARTLNDPSPSAVEALVGRLAQDKIDDGQLDESELTFDDVRIIKRVLVRTLNSMFHQRVQYPEDEGGRS